jgi:hypothetical protein
LAFRPWGAAQNLEQHFAISNYLRQKFIRPALQTAILKSYCALSHRRGQPLLGHSRKVGQKGAMRVLLRHLLFSSTCCIFAGGTATLVFTDFMIESYSEKTDYWLHGQILRCYKFIILLTNMFAFIGIYSDAMKITFMSSSKSPWHSDSD